MRMSSSLSFDLILGNSTIFKSNFSLMKICPPRHVLYDHVVIDYELSRPFPRPTKAEREGETRDWTKTLYILFQTLIGSSLITESKCYIQRYKNKTTTVVVFTVSIHTVLSPIYICIYEKKNCTFTYSYSELGTYV